jgi:hypothetical protein
MQHSDLQLYHKYNAMAINFLRIKSAVQVLYQNRTQDVPLTNRFVENAFLSHWMSINSVSGILFLLYEEIIFYLGDCFSDRLGWKAGPF